MYIATQRWRKQFAVATLQAEDNASTKAARYQEKKNTHKAWKNFPPLFQSAEKTLIATSHFGLHCHCFLPLFLVLCNKERTFLTPQMQHCQCDSKL